MMKGHVHTDTLIGAILRQPGLRTGRRMGHVFYMTIARSEQALLIIDAALDIAPGLKTKRTIVRNAVDLCHTLGIAEPKIEILSASETLRDRMPSSIEVKAITDRAMDVVPGASVFGPPAFNTISRGAALLKGIEHPVAGDADVVVPSMECGNVPFETMVCFMGACTVAVVVGGSTPVMLTSHADGPAARLGLDPLAVIAARGSSETCLDRKE